MKNLKIKSLFAAIGFMAFLLGSTVMVSAQAANWCRWDDRSETCKPQAPNGYCAVSGPNCDVPVVE